LGAALRRWCRCSEGFVAGFAGADPDDLIQRRHENLPVADLAGAIAIGIGFGLMMALFVAKIIIDLLQRLYQGIQSKKFKNLLGYFWN
jgi:RsiW-degrading membrane proteinase PrsW (M82 family)